MSFVVVNLLSALIYLLVVGVPLCLLGGVLGAMIVGLIKSLR